MAGDQRYCLECGHRRGEPRLDYLAMLRPAAQPPHPATAPPRAGFTSILPTPRVAAACVLAVLAFGVILGAAGTAPIESSLASARRSVTIVLPPVASAPVTRAPEPPRATPAAAPEPAAPAPEPAARRAPAATPPPENDTPVTNDEEPAGPQYPGIKHVWVITSAPPPSAELAAQGTLLTGYKALTTGSLANTIALISGQRPNPDTQAECPVYKPVDPGTVDDEGQAQGSGCVYSDQVYTLPDQLSAAGKTWKAYVDGIGTPCRHPDLGAPDPWTEPRPDDPYVTHRNPFVYFTTITSSPGCTTEVVGTEALDGDLADKAKTPALSFAIAPVAADDAWLTDAIDRITASDAYRKNGLVVITGDQPGALLLSKFAEPGGSFDTEYDQLSLLKTLAGVFSLRELGAAQDEEVKPFDESVFASSSQDVHQSATRR